ncbi:N-6 DNA methylase [Patescibacteria group bacterium]|nr:N-6 DNA methylase [Patescibacteria group bacterium]
MDKQQTKEKIKKLVDRYQDLSEPDKRHYNEQQTKDHFIRPLFEALGWDFENDVWAETSVVKKRVDYGFKVSGIMRFFLEAKPLSIDLDLKIHARQAINYSWNKGINWAVLTNFKNIKIFNAQAKSTLLQDKLVFEIPYNEYLEDFERIWLLSKESFENNGLDKYAEKYGKKLKKMTVNGKLFDDLKEARRILTLNFTEFNKEKPEIIDEGVQRILDRLIFIRVLEDKGLEAPILRSIVHQWESGDRSKQIFSLLTEKFEELDDIYNSDIFKKHACEDWKEYSDAIKKVIEMFYGTDIYEYDFKQIPADILGGVYESYLGYIAQKPIEVDKEGKSGKLFRIENKEELRVKSRQKRKEQGIYYTPKFIVDYIVKNTLGRKLEDIKSIYELKQIKVLDLACGSGSFLTKSLETINDKYKDFGNRGDQMTKSEILLSNIYGVDLDLQAVELAKLNLLIDTLDRKAKLPDLTDHIRVGNSLISGTEKELRGYFGKNWRDKKPFNWQEEFGQEGFDVVIGNPPYIFARGGSFDENEKRYYSDNFKLQEYQINTFVLFIERGLNLLKEDGYFGFIVPNNWLTINSAARLREYLLKNTGDLKIINAVDTVFGQASVDTCLLLFRKTVSTEIELGELKDGVMISLKKFKPEDFYENDFIINIARAKGGRVNKILEKLNSGIELSNIVRVSTGLKAYQIGKGKPAQTEEEKNSRKFHADKKLSSTYIKYLDGIDVRRYSLNWSGEYLSYGDWLAEPRKSVPFKGPRILVRQIPSQPPHCINGVFTDEEFLNDINSMVVFNSAKAYGLKYILGVINSRLLSYWFINTFDKFQRKIFPQFKVNELARFPIYPASKNQQAAIVKLVDKTLDLSKQVQAAPENSDMWSTIKREIEKIDKEIDEKVYQLYGLTEEEIEIIGGEQ